MVARRHGVLQTASVARKSLWGCSYALAPTRVRWRVVLAGDVTGTTLPSSSPFAVLGNALGRRAPLVASEFHDDLFGEVLGAVFAEPLAAVRQAVEAFLFSSSQGGGGGGNTNDTDNDPAIGIGRKLVASCPAYAGGKWSRLFSRLDAECRGSVTAGQFRKGLRQLARVRREQLSDMHIVALFGAAVTVDGAELTKDAFVAFMRRCELGPPLPPPPPPSATTTTNNNNGDGGDGGGESLPVVVGSSGFGASGGGLNRSTPAADHGAPTASATASASASASAPISTATPATSASASPSPATPVVVIPRGTDDEDDAPVQMRSRRKNRGFRRSASPSRRKGHKKGKKKNKRQQQQQQQQQQPPLVVAIGSSPSMTGRHGHGSNHARGASPTTTLGGIGGVAVDEQLPDDDELNDSYTPVVSPTKSTSTRSRSRSRGRRTRSVMF